MTTKVGKYDLILAVADAALSLGFELNLTKLQKLVYLIQKRGLDIPFHFRLYHYGPYNATLNTGVRQLISIGLLKADEDAYDSYYGVKINEVKESSLGVLPDFDIISYRSLRGKIARMLEGIRDRTAKDFELLATAAYVASALRDRGELTREQVFKSVDDIKPGKFDKSQVNRALDELVEEGFVGF